MKMNKFIAAIWMASAAVFGIGVFLLAQSSIGPVDVANARNGETTSTLKYRDTINESTALKNGLEAPVSKAFASEKTDHPVTSEAQDMPPVPVKKEGGPDKWVHVAGSDAVMRSKASEAAPMIVAFPVGRKLFVLDERDGWTKVEEPKTATAGWIKADQLQKPGQMQMARLEKNKAPVAMDESESRYSDDWATNIENTEVTEMRPERRRNSGPLGGLLRRAFGR